MKKYLTVLLFLLVQFKAIAAEPLDRVVAVVNDSVITASELESQFNLMRQQQQLAGQTLPDDDLRKQVLQHLIVENLELQLAKQNNLSIDNTELKEALERIASTNKLNLEELRKAIEAQGLHWKTYQASIRKEILISRLQQKMVAKEAVVTPKQVEDFVKSAPEIINNDALYHLENIIIPLSEEPTSEELKNARTKAFSILSKAKNGADFSKLRIEETNSALLLEGGDLGERHLAELPDLFAREVVKMKVGQVRGPLRAGNGLQLIKLASLSNTNSHHEVTKYHVRHILLKADEGTIPEAARKQAFNLYQQIKSGKDFAKIAKKYSHDVKSGIKGGDLGWVSPGEVVPPFEKAMLSLPLHVVSKPVKSGFGWHIIEVLAHKTVDDSESFKRQQVQQLLQQKKFTEAVQNWQQHLRNSSYVKIMDKKLA